MCRNIRTLYNYEPPATAEEIHSAALQYVRKISGFNKPSHANEEAFDRAVDAVAAVSARLLAAPLLDVSRNVSTIGERGFFSLAFAPDFARTRLYYVDYSDRRGNLIVEEFRADASGEHTVPGSARIVLRQAHPITSHNGGLI